VACIERGGRRRFGPRRPTPRPPSSQLALAHARFADATTDPAAISCLPLPALLALLGGDGVAAGEGAVFGVAAAWLAADPERRAAAAPALVAAVRMPAAALMATSATAATLASLPTAAAAALRAALESAATLPPASPPRPRARPGGDLMLAVGGHDDGWRPFRTTEAWAAPATPGAAPPLWRPGPRAPAPLPFASAAPASSGRCYVVAGAATRTTALVLERGGGGGADPAAPPRWRTLPPPSVARIHAAAAALGDDLYVCGGRPGAGAELASVEVWRPAAERWAAGPPLTRPRTAAAAATVGGVVHVVGGQTGKDTHAGGEWLDSGAGGRWLPLGPRARLATPRKYAVAVEWGGRLVVAGGVDALRMRLATCEAFDPREGVWRPLPDLAVPRSGAGAAVASGGLLFVAGGTPAEGDGAVESVEALAPGGKAWVAGPPLAAPRAGLALLAV